jgi:hypothetical protein
MMIRVTIKGWEPGLKKVSLNHLLRETAHLGLAEAKGAVDRILLNEPVMVHLPDFEAAEAFRSSARALGAVCSLAVVESEASLT